MSYQEMPGKRRINIPLGNLIWAILFLLAVGAACYFYYQTKNPEKLSEEKEKEDLVQELSQYLELPTDEAPTLATVTDREKLADQPFFLRAENGDKVLIYSQSGKAILYRPDTKKVIDMTTADVQRPVENPEATEAQASESTEPEEPVVRQDLTVTILNGGTQAGVITTTENKIKESLQNYIIEKKVSATRSNYQGVTVVDRTGGNTERAQELATLLGGKVGALPEGETATSNIAIIIGN